jgi:hypothetical protein
MRHGRPRSAAGKNGDNDDDDDDTSSATAAKNAIAMANAEAPPNTLLAQRCCPTRHRREEPNLESDPGSNPRLIAGYKYPMRHHLVNHPYSLDSFLASQNNYYFFTTTGN